MYYGGYYGMYWDPTYILVIIGMVICLLASARVKSTYAKFNRVRSHSGITAAEAAESTEAAEAEDKFQSSILFWSRNL